MKILHQRQRNICRNTGTSLMKRESSLFHKKKRIKDGISRMVGDYYNIDSLINESFGIFLV